MLPGDSVPRPGPSVRLTVTTGDGGTVVLNAAGEVDSLTAPDLQEGLDALLTDPACRRLVLDLSAITFLSSAGLTVLVSSREQAQAREIDFRLAGLDGNRVVRRPLEVTGVLDLFTPG